MSTHVASDVQAQRFRDLRAHNAYRTQVERLRQNDVQRSRHVQRILELNRHRIMALSENRRKRAGA